MNEDKRKKMLEILEEMRSELRETNLAAKYSDETGDILLRPLKETFGATAIRCNYCILQAEHRCVLILFGLDVSYKCCSLQKLPVDFNKIEGKFPKERLTKFLNNSLQ